MLSIFSEEELGTDSDAKTVVVNEINRYNRRFSGEPLSVSINFVTMETYFINWIFLVSSYEC